MSAMNVQWACNALGENGSQQAYAMQWLYYSAVVPMIS